MKKTVLILGALLLSLLPACGGSEPEMTSITLPMGYIPDPQFAPVYVALEKGYFADAGFDIELDYSFETDSVALVGSGQEPFGLVSGDVVLSARAEEVPLVYVMEWYQKYPIAIVSRAAANITSPADLAGRQLGIPGFWGATYIGYGGLTAAAGLDTEAINVEEVGFNQIESLLTGQVDAALVYANNEPIQLEAMGEAINIILISDYVDLVATGVVTNETYAAENPERVRAFVAALTKGLQDTLDDPDEAFEISKNYIEGLDDSRRGVLDASIEMWRGATLGETDPASWQTTQDTLMSMGFLEGPLDDLEAAYTNEFLP